MNFGKKKLFFLYFFLSLPFFGRVEIITFYLADSTRGYHSRYTNLFLQSREMFCLFLQKDFWKFSFLPKFNRRVSLEWYLHKNLVLKSLVHSTYLLKSGAAAGEKALCNWYKTIGAANCWINFVAQVMVVPRQKLRSPPFRITSNTALLVFWYLKNQKTLFESVEWNRFLFVSFGSRAKNKKRQSKKQPPEKFFEVLFFSKKQKKGKYISYAAVILPRCKSSFWVCNKNWTLNNIKIRLILIKNKNNLANIYSAPTNLDNYDFFDF